MTEPEILLIKAISSFEKKANELIKLLADEFDLDLTSKNPFSKLLNRSNNLWKGVLKSEWVYQFHGDACKFEHVLSNQLLDIKINRSGHYGVISNFYLFEYIKTTKELDYVLKVINTSEIFHSTLLCLEKNHIIIALGQFPFESRVLDYEALPLELREKMSSNTND